MSAARPNSKNVALGILAGVMLLGLAPGLVDVAATHWDVRMGRGLSPEALGHYAYIKHHLQRPFKGYATAQTLLPGFQIIALSQMACGLANVSRLDPARRSETRPLLEEIIRRATSAYVERFPEFIRRPQSWRKQNLYLSHLNLILGAYRIAGGDARFEALKRANFMRIIGYTTSVMPWAWVDFANGRPVKITA
jgi:hypothetical protein